MVTKKSVSTSDGVTLSYLEAGSGKPLVLIPGWSQTAEQFKHQIEGLLGRYRVIALDICGHFDSEKPAFGYRIQRLAKDVGDVLNALDVLVGDMPISHWAAPPRGQHAANNGLTAKPLKAGVIDSS